MTSSQRTSIQLALLAFAAALFTSIAFADTYTLTGRVTPGDSGSGGLPTGVSIIDLTADDTLTVTATGAQLYFDRSANLVVPITISGFGDGTGAYHSTGKFRMQNNGTVVNLNGLVTLAGDTFIGSHDPVGNQGTLNFNNQITGSGGLITCIGTNGYVHLNNTSQTNLNNYQGNTQLGYPEMYNYNSYRPYAGVVYLDADEQIPDALTAGSTATGNLILNSYTSNNQISKLYLGTHTETVNGLVSEDTGTALSIITGDSGSNLTVGANNATASYSGLLQGAMQLEKIGTGTQTLSGANTYTGATAINAGTLELTGAGTLGSGSITDNATLKLNFSTDKTLTNAISGTGAIVKEGTNTVKLDGTFTSYEGNMTINGGAVSLYANDSNKFYIKNISGSGDLELRLAGPTGGRDVQLPNLTNDGFTGYISLVQEGSLNGNKIATGGKTYEGFKFKVNNGTSIFVNGDFKADSYISGNGNYENRGAIRLYNNLSGNIIVTADANIGFQGSRTISGSITSGAASGEVTLFINGKTDGTTVTANRDAGTYTGSISDGTSGSKLGIRIVSNTHTFSGALSYTGATTVNAGTTMNLSGANANLKSSRAVTLNGNLNFSNYTGSDAMKLNDLSGTTAASTITGTNKSLILNNTSNTSYAGSITLGTGSLTKDGTGTLTLSAANTYTGGTTISAGTLELTGSGTLGSGSITDNATLKLNFSTDKTFTNAISGTGTIVKEGTNTVKLDSAVSYAGNLTINGGKVSLLANGGQSFQVKKLSGSGDLELRLSASGATNSYLPNISNNNFTGYISLVQEGNANGNKFNTGGKSYEGFKFKVNDGTQILVNGNNNNNNVFKADAYISGNGNSENRGALRIVGPMSGNIILMANASIGIDGDGRTVSSAITSGAASGETTLFINGQTNGTTALANRSMGSFTGSISDGTSGSTLGVNVVSNRLTFSGTLSYTGATTVKDGATISLSGTKPNLDKSRAAVVNGTLDFSDYTGTDAIQVNNLTGGANGSITGMNKDLVLNNNENTTFAGHIITGSGTVTKNGTGTLTLSAKDALSHSGEVVVNSAIAATADQTLHNLSGSGDITFSNNANLTLANTAQSTYTGTISGVNTLSVIGDGGLNLTEATLSAANFETKEGANVSISSEKPITVTSSFRQGDANFAILGGSATVSGANVAQQATIALNGGTMSFSSYNSTAPELPNYSGLALHLDASAANSFDNTSSITTWNNLADSSNNLTFNNMKGDTRAAVTQLSQGGLSVVTFPTTGEAYYDLTTAIAGKTFFAVMADYGNTSSSDYSFLFGNKDNSNYYFHRGAGTTLWASAANGNVKSGRSVINGTVVANGASIGTDWDVFSLQTRDSSGNPAAVSLSAISRERSSVPIRGWRGDIAEILVYTEALTDAQVLEVTKYLATKWNVGPDVVEPTVVTSGAFVSTNAINVVADSTIDVGEFTSVTFGSTSIDEGKTLTVNIPEDQSTSWESSISGNGGLTKTGTGTLTLSQAPDYKGATTVEAGTLALPEGGTLYNLSGGSVDESGHTDVAAVIYAPGQALTLSNNDLSKFIGSITAQSIIKDDLGTLQIYGEAEGSIDVQSLTVSSGRLDLKGYMTGGITVDANTIFSPGNSVGEATLDGSFILNAAAILLMEQDATGMDKLTASSFEIDPNAILELTVGAAIPGATYDIIFQKNGDTAVDFTGDQATDDFWNSLLTSESAYYWNLSVNGNVVSATLDANAVPEPSTWALLALGVLVLFLRKRVRN